MKTDVTLRLRTDKALSESVVEQGVPVEPMDQADVGRLRLIDHDGAVVPASIEPDGRDERGRVAWVRVSAPVSATAGELRCFALSDCRGRSEAPSPAAVEVRTEAGAIELRTPVYSLFLTDPGRLLLSTPNGAVLDGDVRFQLWPDARSIIGAGAGTCRLAEFVPEGWHLEERAHARCLVVLKGHVPKYTAYTDDPDDTDPTARFDCELELICYAFSPVIRFRWRTENQTVWQAYLERYCLVLPLASGTRVDGGERSEDGKFLRYAQALTPGGSLAVTAPFVDALGPGAGLSFERRKGLNELSLNDVAAFAGGGIFEPHRYLAAERDDGSGLDLVHGGVNPPPDGNMAARNPEVHRLFYLGMGRTFEGALLLNASQEQVGAELDRVYFELEPDYYSRVGALPEAGDPVEFGEFREQVFAAAEWMLREQWRGTLWWGEWWREWDVYRCQGIESTANGNSPLGPLYHYWRTGDARFVDCAKRAMEFVYDVQLSKRRGGLGPFFHSRRFLMDKMEWVHMRYQRIEGPMKAAHFFGDRRLRTKIIDAMRTYAENLVCPSGAPGYGSGGPDGRRVPAGADCTNFQEVLVICWRETGEDRFLELARKMARWTIRHMGKWNWDKDKGNSYHWHFLMRGMLSTIKATASRRCTEWYLDLARRNTAYDTSEINFVYWMDWLIVEAEKMGGERAMLDVLLENTRAELRRLRPDGGALSVQPPPWSKWPTTWDRIYDSKCIVAYVPVLTARLAVS